MNDRPTLERVSVPSPPAPPPQGERGEQRLPASSAARAVALSGHLLLIAGLLAFSPTRLGLVVALVLLLPLPGLWRARPYTYAWAAMLLSFYAAALLAEGYARPAHQLPAFALAGVAGLEFLALILFVRFRAVERRRQELTARTGA